MTAENPKYWGLEGDDELSCTDIEERLQKYIDWLEGETTEVMEMVGFDPIPMNIEKEIVRTSDIVLESTLEYLDDNYSSSRKDVSIPTDKMKEAAKEFAKKIIEEYEIEDCEEVCRKMVSVKDYLNDEDLQG